MRPVPDGIEYVYPPTTYADGRPSICTIPDGFVQMALSDEDMDQLSDEFGIEAPLVKAVMAVESSGSGFLLKEPPPARPKILFEAHQFYRLTPVPVSKTRPDLASPTWDRSLYKGGSAEWPRLLDAMTFDETMALQSASWGLGQVMGFNYKVVGCSSVTEMVTQAFAGEYWQAWHMMNFIANNDLISKLTNHDWAGFAYRYNGAGYATNQYDKKLAAAFERASAG